MIFRTEEGICNQIVGLDGSVGSDDAVLGERFGGSGRVQASKIVSKSIGATNGAVGEGGRRLEKAAVFVFREAVQLVEGDGGTACFGDVVLAVVFVFVHPLREGERMLRRSRGGHSLPRRRTLRS